MKLPAFFTDVLDLLFPRECHLCGNVLPRDVRFICPACRTSLPRTGFHRLPDNAMERRFMGRFPFEHASGHFFYSRESDIARLIHDFKYRRFPDVAFELGAMVGGELVMTPFLAGIDIILPVPLHWRKLLRRGYNQSDMIARGLSSVTGITVGAHLRARRHHGTQTSLSRTERMANVEGIFRIRDVYELSGKGVLLVDDVCTTGATLGECAECLSRAVPDCRISLLTLGVTF